MAHDLKYCPFCGAQRDLKVREGYWAAFDLPSAQVVCGHCSAKGSRFLDETLEEATAQAIQNWNDAYRPWSWWLALKRFTYPVWSRFV